MAGSTPIYGFPYPQSTDLVADYPTLGQELAEDVETVISGLGSGLNIITPTSIANSGGSASASGGAITVTGCLTVSLNGIFSSNYDNYRIVYSDLGSIDGANDLWLRVRASGTDLTTSLYVWTYMYVTGAGGPSRSVNQQDRAYIGYIGTKSGNNILDVTNPHATKETAFTGNHISYSANGAVQSGITNVVVNNTTAYDGITFGLNAGTMTGIIRIYGYKNS